jgi:myo-inositol-1(or 4)-monophosphatase
MSIEPSTGLAFWTFARYELRMTTHDKKQILKTAMRAAKAGGAITVKYFRRLKHVSEKRDAGLVSEADQQSEEKIRTMVKKAFPQHRFLGEETGLTENLASTCDLWIVDPLDGTTNYVHGFPFFCVSIGFESEGKVQVGVVHAPLLGQTYWAVRGGGAFLNGRPIGVSRTKVLDNSLLATGFSYQKKKLLQRELNDFKALSERVRGIRRCGSAALDLCMVASGVFDGFWERALAPWDTAAGSLIVREAGGLVTDFSGAPFHPDMKTIVAAPLAIHRQLLRVLKHR